MIKAIETVYNGYRMRSRLEARWAIAFDVMGIKWAYELEGFELSNGVRYLPDFWFPEVKCWAEVKPGTFTTEEKERCQLLADSTGKPVILLDGMPEDRPYNHRGPNGAGGYWAWSLCLGQAVGCPAMPLMLPPWNEPHPELSLDQLKAAGWDVAIRDYMDRKRAWAQQYDSAVGPRWEAAILAAKRARFEERKHIEWDCGDI